MIDGPLKSKKFAGLLITHYHPDHIGMAGWLQKEYGHLESKIVQDIFVNKNEADGVKKVTGISDSDINIVESGDHLTLGLNDTELIEANGALEFHRIEMKKGGVCSKHLHEFKWNGFYVEEGTMLIRVWQNDYDLVDETILYPGDYTKVKPGVYHQFECIDEGYFDLATDNGIKGSELERVAGIEPASSAWKAEVIPIYDTRVSANGIIHAFHNFHYDKST